MGWLRADQLLGATITCYSVVWQLPTPNAGAGITPGAAWNFTEQRSELDI